MCALCTKQTSYTWWKPNDSISEGVMFKPGKCKMEGLPRPYLPRAAKHLTPALLGPTQGTPPPPPRLHLYEAGGPQALPCARPIKRLIRHCPLDIMHSTASVVEMYRTKLPTRHNKLRDMLMGLLGETC